MGNASSNIDFDDSLAVFLATPIGDATFAELITTLKFDKAGEEALASQIDSAAGQLWSNNADDYLLATYPFHYRATKTWRRADAAARDALGSDDGLAVDDIGYTEDTNGLFYVVSVDGAASSTWAALPGLGADTLAATLVAGNATGGTNLVIDSTDSFTMMDGSGGVNQSMSGGDLSIEMFDGAPSLVGTTFYRITANWEMPSDLTLDSAAPTLTVGDASGIAAAVVTGTSPTVDVTGTSSPSFRLNKGGASTGDINFRTVAGADTTNDKRIRHVTTERLTVDHYNGATFDSLIDIGATDVDIPQGDLCIGGAATAATLVDLVKDELGTAFIRWTNETFTRFQIGLQTDEDFVMSRFSAAGAPVDDPIIIPAASGAVQAIDLDPQADQTHDHGTDALRWQYLYHGTPAPEVSAAQDNATYNLTNEGMVRVSAATGNVTLQLPPSISVSTGCTWNIIVEDISNTITLARNGADTINRAAADDTLGSLGRYIVTTLGNGDTASHGPIAET